MDTKITYIYGLTEGSLIKYVGKTNTPYKRKEEHIYEAIRENRTDKDRWINSVLNNGNTIGISILDIVPRNKWDEREKFWINYYGYDNLTNLSRGGKGKDGYTEEMKRTKNLKITPTTHKILKEYCEKNGLKMFAFVEKLIREKCEIKKDVWGEELDN